MTIPAMEIGDETPTALYRLFDASGALLYVGISDNLRTRFTDHAATKPWWPQVKRKTVQWHLAREAAAAAEKAAIRDENPAYNLAGMEPALRQRMAADFPAATLPAWSASEAAKILDLACRLLARGDISHTHARLRTLNALLTGRDQLPHGGALAILASRCGVSRREAYIALSLERD